MSFFSKLFEQIGRIFGRKPKQEEAPRVPYTPAVERPPYVTTGKFQPPEVTVPETPRVRAITEELPPKPQVSDSVRVVDQFLGGTVNSGEANRTDLLPNGFPAKSYEFQPGVWYTPYGGTRGGPFKTPAESFAWMDAIDRNRANSQAATEAIASQVHGGVFSAVGGVNENEARMLYAANRALHQKTAGRGGDIFYHHQILEGQIKDIANWINTGERLFNAIPGNADYDWAFTYSKGYPDIRPMMLKMVENVVNEAKRLS